MDKKIIFSNMSSVLTMADIHKAQLTKSIIKNGTFAMPLDLKEDIVENLIFENVTFNQFVRFQHVKAGVLVRFRDCVFNGLFSVTHSGIREVILSLCEFNGGFYILDANIEHFFIKECTSKLGADIHELSSVTLEMERLGTNDKKVSLYQCDIDKCFISGLRDNTDFIITSFDQRDGNYTDHTIASLTYNADSQFKGMLLVAGMKLDSLSLHGDNILGRLYFQDGTVGHVYINRFTNKGAVSFSNSKSADPSTLECMNSNLGKCELYDIDFTQFENIIIENTSVQDIIGTNVKWCNLIGLKNQGTNEFARRREIYRQLKNVMIRQNDKVQELVYHQFEMDALLKELRQSPESISDRFILWLNGFTNAHGHSWTRAIIILGGLTIITYIGNNLLLGNTSFDPKMIFKHIGLTLEAMNPVRKFSAIYDEKKQGIPAGIAYTIDVLYRIAASYLIFQFVSAFRKYVKK